MSSKKNARKKIAISPDTFKGDTDGNTTLASQEEEVKASTPVELEYLDDEPQSGTDEEEDDAMSFTNSVEMRERPDLQGRYKDLNEAQQVEVRGFYCAWLKKHHSLTEQQTKDYEVFDDPDWSGVFVYDEYGNPKLPSPIHQPVVNTKRLLASFGMPHPVAGQIVLTLWKSKG